MTEHRLAKLAPDNLDTTIPYPPQPHTAVCSCGATAIGDDYEEARLKWVAHARTWAEHEKNVEGQAPATDEVQWLRDRNASLRLRLAMYQTDNAKLQQRLDDAKLLAEQWLRLPGTELKGYAADLKQVVDP
jgi:hypothetical protein